VTARERLQAALLAHGGHVHVNEQTGYRADDHDSHDGTLDAAEHRASHAAEYAADMADGLVSAADAALPLDSPAMGQRSPLSRESARAFILGGKAIFTLVSVATGARYTYRVSQGDAREGDTRPAPFFVSLLTGPDNTSEYTYVGMLDQRTGTIRLTRASRLQASSKPVQAFDWTMGRIFAGKAIAGVEVYHCGRCGRCGRLLTVPSSIASGFGPECSAKMGGAQ
jgi:hypothetical protein